MGDDAPEPIATERGPDADWHGTISLPDVPHLHRTFVTREETEGWVHKMMKVYGVHAKGTIAFATSCPFCRWN